MQAHEGDSFGRPPGQDHEARDRAAELIEEEFAVHRVRPRLDLKEPAGRRHNCGLDWWIGGFEGWRGGEMGKMGEGV